MLLSGKVALVTGSSRGIGAAVAKTLAAQGACVVVNYVSRAGQAEQVVEEIRQAGGEAIAIRADVTSREEVEAMIMQAVESFGALDIVVNNAISTYSFNPKARKTAWELEWSDYQRQFDGSVQGAFHVCQAALPHMKRQLSGLFVNVLTNLIDLPVVPYHDYTTAKAALLGFTRNMAKELGLFGIRVNAIAPGLTQGTDSSRDTQEETRDAVMRLTPLQRLAVPQDIANAALFLASDLSSFVTGQCLRVDGGLVMS